MRSSNCSHCAMSWDDCVGRTRSDLKVSWLRFLEAQVAMFDTPLASTWGGWGVGSECVYCEVVKWEVVVA